jgi:hypothetical protein
MNSRTITFKSGSEKLEEQLGFSAGWALIDNNTYQYLSVGTTGRYVAPLNIGALLKISSTDKAVLRWESPPGIAQPVAIANQQAIIQWFDLEGLKQAVPGAGSPIGAISSTLPLPTVDAGTPGIPGTVGLAADAGHRHPERGPFRNVKNQQWGAIGDGIVDDTAAIQNAINAGAGTVYLPGGSYKISANLVITADSTTIMGEAQGDSSLVPTAAVTRVIDLTGRQQSLYFPEPCHFTLDRCFSWTRYLA